MNVHKTKDNVNCVFLSGINQIRVACPILILHIKLHNVTLFIPRIQDVQINGSVNITKIHLYSLNSRPKPYYGIFILTRLQRDGIIISISERRLTFQMPLTHDILHAKYVLNRVQILIYLYYYNKIVNHLIPFLFYYLITDNEQYCIL